MRLSWRQRMRILPLSLGHYSRGGRPFSRCEEGAGQRSEELGQHRQGELECKDAGEADGRGVDDPIKQREDRREQEAVALRVTPGEEISCDEEERCSGNVRTPRSDPQGGG